MRDTRPLLFKTQFPAIKRKRLETLQANLGYRCNQSCQHCHVNAGPKRSEGMSWETMQLLLRFAANQGVATLDLTGGAPELNPHFRRLTTAARDQGLRVIDRCNLTILGEPGQEDLAQFLAAACVDIVASLPCYLEENVDGQRGAGVFRGSIDGMRRLNALGYGMPDSGLTLNLVYNPLGPTLPPNQQQLQEAYRAHLATHHGVVFNQLLALANMPINRFGAVLLAHDEFDAYMQLLKDSHCDDNLANVMCRTLLSVDWRGHVYDCDFNQMLGLATAGAATPLHLSQLQHEQFENNPVRIADHCYGCTAGQGSSCGGALTSRGEATP